MNTPTLYITRGLPASGKTSWARELMAKNEPGTIIRLNRDDLRRSMIDPNYAAPIQKAEFRVSEVQQASAEAALKAGISVVVDDTNLRMAIARTWADMAYRTGAQFICVEFSTPLDECLRRDALREPPERVGEDVIQNMYAKFVRQHIRNGVQTLPPVVHSETISGKPYEPVPGTPKTVMVDIDGTVAKHENVRGPYDTSRYHLDEPNLPVVELVNKLYLAGYAIVFCSGRDEEFRRVTEDWLTDNVGFACWHALYMRPKGDKRNDAVIKLELFDQYIRNRYDVRFVLDDRDRVVKAWRSIGLTVFQVAEGNF